MTPATRYAKSGDVLIAYQVTGDAPITMVLAPGTVSHLDMDWEFPLRAIASWRQFCSSTWPTRPRH